MTDRGQLVLAAAATIAVALLLVMLALLQFGYAGDIQAESNLESPYTDTLDAIERSAWDVTPRAESGDVPTVADTFQEEFEAETARIERAHVDDGTLVSIEINDTLATAFAADRCGDFGPCRANHGVVVQERDRSYYVAAVALDIEVVTQDRTARGTHVFAFEDGWYRPHDGTWYTHTQIEKRQVPRG